MGSIPKIVLTPLKWASRQLLHRTLLRFPGGDSHDPIACTYCPEMCRFSCPTAVVSGSDTVTPCNKMSLLHKEDRWPGQASQGGPLWPIYDCTGCGRCSEYCVYGVPVADTLFEARSRFGWNEAAEAAKKLKDSDDPVGNLAYELGDTAAAERRLSAFVASGCKTVNEPSALAFLKKKGHSAMLSWNPLPEVAEWKNKLSGRRWLLCESPSLSRKLFQAEAVSAWVASARIAGIQIELPFQSGKDCIDHGGEGAYMLLFPQQAAQMARDVWERDRHRADGILCYGERSAVHFRKVLDGSIPVVSFSEGG